MNKHGIRLRALGRETWAKGDEPHPFWNRPRSLERHELWFVWGGRALLVDGSGGCRIGQGMAVLMSPGREYEVQRDPAAQLSVNFFQIEAASAELPSNTLFAEKVDVFFFEAVTRRILDLYWQAFAANGWKSGPATPVAKFTSEPETVRTGAFCPNPIHMFRPARAHSNPLLALADDLFLALLGDLVLGVDLPAPPPPRALGLDRKQRDTMLALADRIRKDPTERSMPAVLASEAGYSRDHFARVFHKVIGTSPKAFLLAARIERAKALLAQSDLTVKEIADSLDYSSPYFFSRQFRSATGMAPSDFRQKAMAG